MSDLGSHIATEATMTETTREQVGLWIFLMLLLTIPVMLL
jgi:hypothetical protein